MVRFILIESLLLFGVDVVVVVLLFSLVNNVVVVPFLAVDVDCNDCAFTPRGSNGSTTTCSVPLISVRQNGQP